MRKQNYVGQSGLGKMVEDLANGQYHDPVQEAVEVGREALRKIEAGDAVVPDLTDRELACLRGHLVDLYRAGHREHHHLYPEVVSEQTHRDPTPSKTGYLWSH